jgi:hypothetical protein
VEYEVLLEYVLDGIVHELREQVLGGRLDRVRQTVERLLALDEMGEGELRERFGAYLPPDPGPMEEWWAYADLRYDEGRISRALPG